MAKTRGETITSPACAENPVVGAPATGVRPAATGISGCGTSAWGSNGVGASDTGYHCPGNLPLGIGDAAGGSAPEDPGWSVMRCLSEYAATPHRLQFRRNAADSVTLRSFLGRIPVAGC